MVCRRRAILIASSPYQPRKNRDSASSARAEDDPSLRLLLEEALQGRGFGVCGCENGREVLDRVSRGCFSLLLLDAMMPGPSGFDLARSLRESGVATPILLMSYLEPQDALWPFDGLESVTAIAKPFTLKSLMQAVDDILAGVRS